MIEASQPASDGNEMLEIGSGNGFPLSMSLLVTVLRLSLSTLSPHLALLQSVREKTKLVRRRVQRKLCLFCHNMTTSNAVLEQSQSTRLFLVLSNIHAFLFLQAALS